MNEKHEQLFSLPGVIGYGYGRKVTNGLLTGNEALVVFVEKKIPPEELKDEEFIPYAINDLPTDVIEIGEVFAYHQAGKKTVDLRECEILYRLLLNCLGRGAVKPEKLNNLQELAGVIKEDLDKLLMLKRVVSNINPNNYKKATKSVAPFQELLASFNKDLNKITLLTNVLSDINLEIYKNVTKSLGNVVGDLNISDKIREKIERFKNFWSQLMHANQKVDRTSLVRPAVPGVSIGHYQGAAGTFGAVVYDRINNAPFILSNNHVLANISLTDRPKAKANDPIVQPANLDGKNKTIGKLAKYAALNPYPKANVADCALAKPIKAKDIRPQILEIGRIEGVADPVIGMRVKKSGRTTGLTFGEIRAVDATLKVNYGDGIILRFENQIVASRMSEPGDSGSLVVDMKNKAVGLLFAGSNQSTIINPIEPVLDLLGVKF